MDRQTKINCGCGGQYLLTHKARHIRSQKHKDHENFLESVDRDWEEHKTFELDKFIKQYNIIAELKLNKIISDINTKSKIIKI